jgi:DNA-directed RNA polymerase sigma subunit (sigma70/sigma32)
MFIEQERQRQSIMAGRKNPYADEAPKKPFVMPGRGKMEAVAASYNENPRNKEKPKIDIGPSDSDEALYQRIFEAHVEDIRSITWDIIQKREALSDENRLSAEEIRTRIIVSTLAFADIINDYDSSRGAAFSTYLYEGIRMELRSHEEDTNGYPTWVYHAIGVYKGFLRTDDVSQQDKVLRPHHDDFSAEGAVEYITGQLRAVYELKGTRPPKNSPRDPYWWNTKRVNTVRDAMHFNEPVSLETPLSGDDSRSVLLDTLFVQQPSIAEMVIEKELQERVQAATLCLTPIQQKIITWRFSDPRKWELKPDGSFVERERLDLDAKIPTHKYIGAILGIHEQTSFKHEKLALRKLHELVVEADDDPPGEYLNAAKASKSSRSSSKVR